MIHNYPIVAWLLKSQILEFMNDEFTFITKAASYNNRSDHSMLIQPLTYGEQRGPHMHG